MSTQDHVYRVEWNPWGWQLVEVITCDPPVKGAFGPYATATQSPVLNRYPTLAELEDELMKMTRAVWLARDELTQR